MNEKISNSSSPIDLLHARIDTRLRTNQVFRQEESQ